MATYTPLGNNTDSALTSEQQAQIASFKDTYNKAASDTSLSAEQRTAIQAKAHADAEALRSSAGYSGGADGSQKLPIGASAPAAAPAAAPTAAAPAYTPLGSYNDSGLTADQQAQINTLKQQWEATHTNTAGLSEADRLAQEAAIHKAAEDIRAAAG
ncbi:MAG: hypothetical protein EOM14_09320, partial [Clostridia bacterium]|nr:hypothetical protein [Clostridia bacterium]